MSSLPFISHHLFVSAAVPSQEALLANIQEELRGGILETSVENERGETSERLAVSETAPQPIQELVGGDTD
jgi:hypothetical protein